MDRGCVHALMVPFSFSSDPEKRLCQLTGHFRDLPDPERTAPQLRTTADLHRQDLHPRGQALNQHRERQGQDPGQGRHPARPAAPDLRRPAAGGRPYISCLRPEDGCGVCLLSRHVLVM
jgi:hypothetical protein